MGFKIGTQNNAQTDDQKKDQSTTLHLPDFEPWGGAIGRGKPLPMGYWELGGQKDCLEKQKCHV